MGSRTGRRGLRVDGIVYRKKEESFTAIQYYKVNWRKSSLNPLQALPEDNYLLDTVKSIFQHFVESFYKHYNWVAIPHNWIKDNENHP